MCPSHKRPISPLATNTSRPHKVLRTSYSAKERVASAELQQRATTFQSTQREAEIPVFTAGDIKATATTAGGSVTFTPAHSFSKLTTTAATVPREIALDVNVSCLGLNDLSPPSTGTDVYPSNNASPGNEEMVVSASLATPELSDSPTPGFYLHQVPKEENESKALAGDLTAHGPAIVGDGERSELSYASDYTQYPTDRSITSSSPATRQSTPNGWISPYAASFFRENSYQARRHGLERPLVGLPEIPDPETGGVDSTPLDPEIGVHYPQDLAASVETASGSSTEVDIRDDTMPPFRGSAHAANSSAPHISHLHRVRFRGVFVVGNGAAIRIDESIGVYLRDGANGQVDFII